VFWCLALKYCTPWYATSNQLPGASNSSPQLSSRQCPMCHLPVQIKDYNRLYSAHIQRNVCQCHPLPPVTPLATTLGYSTLVVMVHDRVIDNDTCLCEIWSQVDSATAWSKQDPEVQLWVAVQLAVVWLYPQPEWYRLDTPFHARGVYIGHLVFHRVSELFPYPPYLLSVASPKTLDWFNSLRTPTHESGDYPHRGLWWHSLKCRMCSLGTLMHPNAISKCARSLSI
jgi:hypothetical protein